MALSSYGGGLAGPGAGMLWSFFGGAIAGRGTRHSFGGALGHGSTIVCLTRPGTGPPLVGLLAIVGASESEVPVMQAGSRRGVSAACLRVYCSTPRSPGR